MQNLINELQLPRTIAPSPVAIRAAKLLSELYALQQSDLQARKLAEQKLSELESENIKLQEELNEAKKRINELTASSTTNS